MKIHNLHREQFLPISIEAAWNFFSAPENLDKLTPPEVKFETLSAQDKPLHHGMKIKYKLRPLMNIPVMWETLILGVDVPYKFIDKQLKGPYALWEHTHTFAAVNGGVKITDDVIYALPFGFLGSLMHAIVVKKKLSQIFDFRRAALVRLFGQYKEPV
jgi:ligand-binding SRPBCC domain-containing protein